MDFADRNILITGGSKGIGLAVAREFAQRGANPFLIARGQDSLDDAQQALVAEFPKVRVGAQCCDVADFDAVERTIDSMRHQFGEIHGLFNNAGYAIADYFEQIDPDDFRRLMEVNYLGSVFPTKVAVPHMQRGSFVAFTSSVVGYIGGFGYSGYCATKFALIGFAECLDQELAERGIQVSVLCPQDTQTPGFDTENERKPFETHELSKRARIMSPEQVAAQFIKGLTRGRFLINAGFDGRLIYRIKGWLPEFSRRLMHHRLRQAQRNKPAAG